jgi:ABC-2 type transport system permease protein
VIDAIRSEWIKVSTIRVTWILALAAAAFPLVVTVLTAIFSEDPPTGRDLAGLVAGLTIVSAMLLAVVSSLSITNEFSHGTIRPTFAALPDRLRPLLAKPIVQVAIAIVLVMAIVVAGWVSGSALAEGTQSLDDDGVLPSLVGVVLLAVGLSLLGYGLGLLLRNTAATICLLLLWPLIAESLIAGLLVAVGAEGAIALLPYTSGFNMAVVDPDPDSFGRVGGGLYFFAWVLVILVIGIVAARRRDA